MSIRSRLPLPRLLVPVLAVLGPLVSSAHAAPQNRISRQITDSDRASVRETVPVRARLSADLGEAADRQLSAVSLYFNRTDAQQADLTQLLQDQQNPASPHYHQWLTPQQFGSRFGLTEADLQKVQAWLTSGGMKVVAVAPSRNYVTVSGNLRQIEAAFRTSIHSVSFQGQRHFSNLSDPQLPTPIANLVAGISGLNDFGLRPHAVVKPHFTSSSSGLHFIAPGDFYSIYDVNSLLSQGIDGTGLTIAIIGQTDLSLSDVAAFRSAAGLPAKTPQVTQATGYVAGTRSTGDSSEAQLDVEWAGAVAPNATINFVTVGASSSNFVDDALSFAISHNLAPIISMSYGLCETLWNESQMQTINQMLQQANAQGITFISSSGDSGATDCDVAPPADYGLTVDFPGSSPFALSAGGTMFNEGSATGGTSYWNAAGSSDNISSAKGYIPEAVWNESTSSGFSSGGGGISSYFPKPAWQEGLTPADASRDVPDVSLNAAANHDGYLFCSQGSCVNGFRKSTGTLNVVGGTSAVSPALAGIFALLEQKLGVGSIPREQCSAGNSNPQCGLGNVNPTIYALGGSQYYGNVFHDITSGNNNSTCQAGTTDCPSGGTIGYSAGSGYDLATGWGSLDVAELVNKWSQVTPVGTSTTTGPNLSSTTVQLASSTSGACSTSGALNITVTVANASSSTNLAIPSGTVQILVDGTAPSGGGIVPLTSGTATYQIPSQSQSGEHTISAIYLGDGVYSSSKGTLVADFVSSSSPDFALTPCTTSISVSSGATASGIPFTVTSANNFNGPVTFSISSDSSIAATFAFSATSVSLAAGSSAQTTLVITAAQSNSSANVVMPKGAFYWYAGSAASFAGIFFFFAPRRRRLTPLVALILTIGAVSISGCGGGGTANSGSSTGGTGGSGGSTTTRTTPGTYTLNVTATGSNGIVHTSTVTLKVN